MGAVWRASHLIRAAAAARPHTPPGDRLQAQPRCQAGAALPDAAVCNTARSSTGFTPTVLCHGARLPRPVWLAPSSLCAGPHPRCRGSAAVCSDTRFTVGASS